MGQFDVHLNQGRTRTSVPFVLVIQSDRYEATTHRVVVPLVLRSELRTPDRNLNPSFTIDGQVVVMDTLQLATLPVKALGPKVGTLDQDHLSVIRAMDALIAQGR
jgi:toxin CcdB